MRRRRRMKYQVRRLGLLQFLEADDFE